MTIRARRFLRCTPAAGLAAMLLLSPALPVLAEKADKEKPTNIESNRMSSDDTKRMSIFEGNVVLTKGTVVVRADRIVVHQDADGFQLATATGKPVRFRQKGDPKDGKEGVWTDGEALEVRLDDRNERIELFQRARVTRDQLGGSHEETDFGSVAHFHSRDGRRMGTALCSQRRGRDEWALASQFA
jgi:lipopolysaccharide export system protein LptA